MKKYLTLAVCFLLLIVTSATAQYKYRFAGQGVVVSSDCSTYTALGQLCQDSDDNKLYKGTGVAVEEIAAGSSDAELVAIANLTSSANAIPYFTGSGTAGVISSSANMVSLLGSADYATARTNLGLAIGTNVQAYDDDLTTFAAITPSADMQAFLAAADDAAAMTELGTWGVSGSITDEQLVCSETTGGTNLLKSCGAKTTYTEPASNLPLCRTGAGTTGECTNLTDVTPVTSDSSTTLTNKTYDVDGTGNVLKSWGYLILTHPHLCSAAAPMQTTSTANTYGQCKFGNATDKATNYAEYYLVVPSDIDTDVDLVGTFKIKLGGADTGDHEYEISFDSVADSAAYVGSLGDAISLAFTADASGADADVETAGPTTLTGWKAAMTAGQLFVVRVARDGDHANDGSSVDSYSGPLIIKYKITQ